MTTFSTLTFITSTDHLNLSIILFICTQKQHQNEPFQVSLSMNYNWPINQVWIKIIFLLIRSISLNRLNLIWKWVNLEILREKEIISEWDNLRWNVINVDCKWKKSVENQMDKKKGSSEVQRKFQEKLGGEEKKMIKFSFPLIFIFIIFLFLFTLSFCFPFWPTKPSLPLSIFSSFS